MPIGIELDNTPHDGVKISVFGVGGAGGNIVNNMIAGGLQGVEYIAANTDKQVLDVNSAQTKLQIGKQYTGGKGAGGNPEVGKKSTEESLEEIKEAIKYSDMLFITAGMGGGTGTGGAPLVAKLGQEAGALVVAFVTTPFTREGKHRHKIADEGIKELRQFVDALIVIPNQNLIEICDRDMRYKDALMKIDDMLFNATRGILGIITEVGLINIDFADVCTILRGKGDALIGTGLGSGKNRAADAIHNALNSPLLNGYSINGSKSVLVNIYAGDDFSFGESDEVLAEINKTAGEDLNLIQGIVLKPEMEGQMMVTILATDFIVKKEKELQPKENIKKSILEDRDTLFHPNPPIPLPRGLNNSSSKVGYSIPDSFNKTNNSYTKPNLEKAASAPKGPDELKIYDSPTIIRTKENEISENNILDNFKKNFNDGTRQGYMNNELNSEKGSIAVPTIFRRIYE